MMVEISCLWLWGWGVSTPNSPGWQSSKSCVFTCTLVGVPCCFYHSWHLFTTFSHFKIEATVSPPECLMLNEVCRQCRLAWNLFILFFFLLLFTKSGSKGDICHLGYDCCPSFVVQCTAKVLILKWHWNLYFSTSDYWISGRFFLFFFIEICFVFAKAMEFGKER